MMYMQWLNWLLRGGGALVCGQWSSFKSIIIYIALRYIMNVCIIRLKGLFFHFLLFFKQKGYNSIYYLFYYQTTLRNICAAIIKTDMGIYTIKNKYKLPK